MIRLPSSVWDAHATELALEETDLLVIGGGVAGFSAAIAASGANKRILVITKDSAFQSNTWAAQGGIAAVLGDDDSPAAHREDTLAVGGGLCDSAAVDLVVTEGPARVRELCDWGGAFDRDEDDRLALTLEGGHSHRRVIHAQGDQTGMEVQRTLFEKAQSSDGVTIREHVFAVDLIVEEGRCCGAVFYDGQGLRAIRAGAVILATGGAGQIYRETTNPAIATADGHAMALRAGALLRDMEFVQFHPTTLYVAGSSRHLITEAVRGEGGLLRDKNGERFMVRYHPDAELAPRDVVSRAIVQHLALVGDEHVAIDLTHLDPVYVRKRFPQLMKTCGLYNIDVTREPVPVHPSVHYVMGGVEVDADAKTSLPGLYAAGEVASSGLHGANRLASNSLLEGLVFGQRAGLAAIKDLGEKGSGPPVVETQFTLEGSVINVPDMLNSIKSLMWKRCGIVRNEEQLAEAERRLEGWARYLFQCRFREPSGWQLANVLTTALAITSSALMRRESRGAHFRSDFPEIDDLAWKRHSYYPHDAAEA